jgi:hypothetical protein
MSSLLLPARPYELGPRNMRRGSPLALPISPRDRALQRPVSSYSCTGRAGLRGHPAPPSSCTSNTQQKGGSTDCRPEPSLCRHWCTLFPRQRPPESTRRQPSARRAGSRHCYLQPRQCSSCTASTQHQGSRRGRMCRHSDRSVTAGRSCPACIHSSDTPVHGRVLRISPESSRRRLCTRTTHGRAHPEADTT